MANKSRQERMTELKKAAELRLRHLCVMVFDENGNQLLGERNQPTFLRKYLCDGFQSAFHPISDDYGTKVTNILNKTIGTSQKGKNGPSESEYRSFYKNVLHKTDILHQQSEHLERKLATKKDVFQKNMEMVCSEIGESFIEILSQKAPWLQEPMDNLQPIPLVEADFYKLLTVATVISLNLDTCTKQTETKDDVDKLCYRFLFDNAVPEALPDFSLKEIFDTLLKGRNQGAVPTPGPEKFIPKEMAQVSEMDSLRILLSGIPEQYTIIPQGGTPEGADEPHANAKQILENGAIQHKIKNLKGFYARYAVKQNLDDLWKTVSELLESNLCAFEEMYRRSDDGMFIAEVLEQIRRGELQYVSGIKIRFRNMLMQCSWVETIAPAFWSGHDVKATIARADVFDCITAFVLIAVYCLKTRPGDANDAIPREREHFKSALIHKIKEVLFPDDQAILHNIDELLEQLRNSNGPKPPEVQNRVIDLIVVLEGCLDENRRLLLYQKLYDIERNLQTNLTLSNINANTKVEESDRDKAKPRLLEPGSNSPIGGK